MEASLITLKLFLDELDIPTDIETVEKRKLIQKAVYLGQRSGVDLGYRFSWYLMGPYSTSLTQDYYKLVEALNTGDSEYKKRKLKENFKEKLVKVKEIFKVPDNVKLSEHGWLELLASLHYLENISKFNESEIKEKLKKEKPDLCKNIEDAKIVLQRAGALLS